MSTSPWEVYYLNPEYMSQTLLQGVPAQVSHLLLSPDDTGVPRSLKTAAAEDPTAGLFLGPYGSLMWVGSF